MEMSNKPPIGCFNGSECIYDPKICRLYEDRTEECRLENLKNWLKETTPQSYQAGKPVGETTTPFDYATMYKILEITQKKRISEKEVVELVKGEMAKAAGLLTSEAAAHLVSANLGLEEIEVPPPKRVATPTTPFNTTGKPVEKPTPKVGAVVGRVMGMPATREVNTKAGPKRVDKFNVESNGESVSITLWERADLSQLINSGDEVTLEGLMEGEPYQGQRQFNGGTRTILVGANVAGIEVPQEKKTFVIKNPNAPATEAQINQLNKMGIKNIAQNITKQQASDLISSRMKK
jgi:hypothetical protein